MDHLLTALSDYAYPRRGGTFFITCIEWGVETFFQMFYSCMGGWELCGSALREQLRLLPNLHAFLITVTALLLLLALFTSALFCMLRRKVSKRASAGAAVALLLFFFFSPGAHARLIQLEQPPMAISTWTAFFCNINETLVQESILAAEELGLVAAGYSLFNLDDCWAEKERDAAGRLVPSHSKFPGGLQSLAGFARQHGMAMGIYNDVGYKTCQSYPGSFGRREGTGAGSAVEKEKEARSERKSEGGAHVMGTGGAEGAGIPLLSTLNSAGSSDAEAAAALFASTGTTESVAESGNVTGEKAKELEPLSAALAAVDAEVNAVGEVSLLSAAPALAAAAQAANISSSSSTGTHISTPFFSPYPGQQQLEELSARMAAKGQPLLDGDTAVGRECQQFVRHRYAEALNSFSTTALGKAMAGSHALDFSFSHFVSDALQYKQWGIAWLKLDFCFLEPLYWFLPAVVYDYASCVLHSVRGLRLGLSVCNWGRNSVEDWAGYDTGASSFRIGNDVAPYWARVMHMLDENNDRQQSFVRQELRALKTREGRRAQQQEEEEEKQEQAERQREERGQEEEQEGTNHARRSRGDHKDLSAGCSSDRSRDHSAAAGEGRQQARHLHSDPLPSSSQQLFQVQHKQQELLQMQQEPFFSAEMTSRSPSVVPSPRSYSGHTASAPAAASDAQPAPPHSAVAGSSSQGPASFPHTGSGSGSSSSSSNSAHNGKHRSTYAGGFLHPASRPRGRGYADMDFLQVGLQGNIETVPFLPATRLTEVEARSHFSLHCIHNSPLIIGADVRLLRQQPEALRIMLNRRAIAINQDTAYPPALLWREEWSCSLFQWHCLHTQAYVKRLAVPGEGQSEGLGPKPTVASNTTAGGECRPQRPLPTARFAVLILNRGSDWHYRFPGYSNETFTLNLYSMADSLGIATVSAEGGGGAAEREEAGFAPSVFCVEDVWEEQAGAAASALPIDTAGVSSDVAADPLSKQAQPQEAVPQQQSQACVSASNPEALVIGPLQPHDSSMLIVSVY